MSALLVIALIGGCGGGDNEQESAGQSSKAAQLLAGKANLRGIHSGEAEVSLDIKNPAAEERVHMQSRALFLGVGREDPPRFDMSVESHGHLGGRKVGFLVALLLQTHHAVLFYRGRTYRPRSAVFDALRSKLERTQKKAKPGDAMACVEALRGEKIARLLHRFRSEGNRRDHDGTPVTLIGAELDAGRAFAALSRMAQDPACGAQLRAVGVPTGAQLEALEAAAVPAMEGSHVQLALDRHTRLRDLSVELVAGEPGGVRLEIVFKWLLENANGLKELPNPAAEDLLPALLRKFGADPAAVKAATGDRLFLGVLEALGDEMTGQ